MTRTSRVALALTAMLLSLLAPCSPRDKVVSVVSNDPETVAAIAKARETLPQFWRVFANPKSGESGFSLKVKITDNKGVEHFWTTEIERRDGELWGTTLLKTLPANEAARYRRMMAEP